MLLPFVMLLEIPHTKFMDVPLPLHNHKESHQHNTELGIHSFRLINQILLSIGSNVKVHE